MEDDLKEAIYNCFMTDDINGDRVNIVDGLFAIAESISDLEKTVGAEPTIDMNKRLCDALLTLGGDSGGLEISYSLDRVADAIKEHGDAIKEHESKN